MSVVTGGSEPGAAGGGGGNRVFFQSPRGGGGRGGGGSSREDSVSAPAAAAVVQVQQQRRHQQGKVTVKYDRKELRKRLVLEEWIVEQLGQLYGCEVPHLPGARLGKERDCPRAVPGESPRHVGDRPLHPLAVGDMDTV
ncbi:protein phosphatase 1 regulatory subunit 14C [Trachemys scripta elegans]|uniref:protein phosphatase 1 regulatory subunit 14C n=1 Tax=Trachemys scripta elegans TaxID=31138 RepID=UPI001556F122|nr:protein phosphatase 1 regulatory subunit 14C [Trachemys scripta elegans]